MRGPRTLSPLPARALVPCPRTPPPLPLVLLLLLLPPPVAAARPVPTTLIVPPEKHTLGIHRVTDVHLRLFTGIGNRFRRPEGIACVKLVETDDPKTSGDDDELTVYGVNSGDGSIIYNDTMTSVKIWRGGMRNPHGIAADASGRVVVADTGNHRVLFLKNTAGRLAVERAVGRRGNGPGEFESPTGVALDSHGRAFVTDTGNHRVQVLDPRGAPIAAFGTRGAAPGSLVSPAGIAVVDKGDPWSYRRRDLVFVVDRAGRRIQSFTGEGRFLKAYEDTARGGLSFDYLALDYHNNLYATDPRRSQIHKFDDGLRLIVSFGERGTADAQFIAPTGITIWRRFGQVFVAESTGAQYYWVGTDVRGLTVLPDSIAPGTPQKIQYALTEPSEVSVAALDGDGATVRAIAAAARQEAGLVRLTWDGKRADGAALAPGRYRIRVDARPMYSSRKYFHREITTAIEILRPPG